MNKTHLSTNLFKRNIRKINQKIMRLVTNIMWVGMEMKECKRDDTSLSILFCVALSYRMYPQTKIYDKTRM